MYIQQSYDEINNQKLHLRNCKHHPVFLLKVTKGLEDIKTSNLVTITMIKMAITSSKSWRMRQFKFWNFEWILKFWNSCEILKFRRNSEIPAKFWEVSTSKKSKWQSQCYILSEGNPRSWIYWNQQPCYNYHDDNHKKSKCYIPSEGNLKIVIEASNLITIITMTMTMSQQVTNYRKNYKTNQNKACVTL